MRARPSLVLPVSEPSQVADARRRVDGLARELGFGDSDLGRLAIVTTEVAGNLAKHTTGGGMLLARALESGGARGVELLALDRGPGIRDVSWSLQDGHSTAGSPGTGLGAISRLSHELQVHSVPGVGTGLLARLWRGEPASAARPPLRTGVVHLPKTGQDVCGDGWAVHQRPGRCLLLVVDGLGHGPGAAEAAAAAERAFGAAPGRSPGATIEMLHDALRPTRGAAAAVVEVDLVRRRICFAGIGNISGAILAPSGRQSAVSHHGILGHRMRTVQEFHHEWPDDALLVLHSDGVSGRWDLDRYPGLAARDPALVAGTLYRDCAREDDVTVLVAREAGAP